MAMEIAYYCSGTFGHHAGLGGVEFDIGPVEFELIFAVVYALFGVYGYQNME